MSYMIKIGATQQGVPLISAHACNRDVAVITTYIYPSQMQYRCTTRDKSDKIDIMTPTEAKRRKLHIVAYFPRANGRFKRR